MRMDGRSPSAFRKVKITPVYIHFTKESKLFELGETKLLCNSTLEERLPGRMKKGRKGYSVTTEQESFSQDFLDE